MPRMIRFDFTGLEGSEGQQRVIKAEAQTSIVTHLHSILKPFLLRRLKTDGTDPAHLSHNPPFIRVVYSGTRVAKEERVHPVCPHDDTTKGIL